MTLSPELRLLLACGRGALDADRPPIDWAPIDWTRALRLARRHKMGPLLHRHLHATEFVGVPPEAAQALRASARTAAVRSLALTRQLGVVLALLETAGISALALKGPGLAVQAYGDLSLREFHDLDLWIDRGAVPEAHARLIERGCRRLLPDAPPAPGREERLFLRLTQENVYTYLLPDGMARLELHWALLPSSLGALLPFVDAWARREIVSLGTLPMPVLGAADHLVYLAAHGAKHRWMRLEWLCAFARIARQAEKAEWTAARRGGAEQALALAEALAQSLGGGAPPTLSGRMPGLVSAVAASLEEDAFSAPPLAEALFYLGLKERWADRLRGYARLAAQPTFADLAALPQARRRFPWYLGVRLGRLGRKYGPRRDEE